MTPMRKIPLEQALPGMVLGEDVTCGAQILLPRGTAISAAQLDGLRRREVGEVAVLAPTGHSAVELEAMREAQQRRLDRLFRRAGSDATMQALLRVVLEYRLEALE